MDKLRIDEGVIAAEQGVDIPKQCTPFITAVLNRRDSNKSK